MRKGHVICPYCLDGKKQCVIQHYIELDKIHVDMICDACNENYYIEMKL